jgi:hypothetical protein
VTDSNLLPRVPGDFVAAAIATLPNSVTAKADTMETVIEVPNLGPVRFFCRKLTHRKGRMSMTCWKVERAVKA